MDNKENWVLRYSLIEEVQQSIGAEELPDIKGHAVLAAISSDREFDYNGVSYSMLGFHPISPAKGYNFPDNRFYMGKLAKRRKQQLGEKVPGDVIESEHDNWIPLVIIVDVDTQHIFVKKNYRFGLAEHIARVLQVAFTPPILAKYNYKVFVEGKTKASTFWQTIKGKDKIYKLDLKLISPNILDTNKKAREALEALKDVFGQEEVGISLKNDSGDLQVPEKPVNNYLEYIAEGEGSWSVVTEGEHGGKKRHSSTDNTESIELPDIEETHNLEAEQLNLQENEKEGVTSKAIRESNLGAHIYAATKDMEKD